MLRVILIYQLTLNLTWWQHLMALVSYNTYRNLLICLHFLRVITSIACSQLLRYQTAISDATTSGFSVR